MTKFVGRWQSFSKFSLDHTEFPEPTGGSRFAQRMFRVLHGHDPSDKLTLWVDRGVATIVILAVILDLFVEGQIGETKAHAYMVAFDWISTAVLTAEFIAKCCLLSLDPRFAGMQGRVIRYLLRPMSILDLIVLIPSWLSLLFTFDLGFMRLIRLLRLVELAHRIMPKWRVFLRETVTESRRKRAYLAMFGDVRSLGIPALVDVTLLAMIVLSIIIVMLESVSSLHLKYKSEFHTIDVLITGIFVIEYALRIYSCVEDPRFAHPLTGRFKYALTWGAIIDLVAILPIFLMILTTMDIRLLWVLRLLRILKLSRYSPSFESICAVVREERAILFSAFLMLSLVTIFAAFGVYVAENASQPEKFSSIPASMYWAVVTLTTIGYGDVYPITVVGQMLTMVLAVVGLGMIALPAGILATGFSAKIRVASRNRNIGQTANSTAEAADDMADQILSNGTTVDQVLRSSHARRRLTEIIDPLSRAEREALLALIAISLSDTDDH